VALGAVADASFLCTWIASSSSAHEAHLRWTAPEVPAVEIEAVKADLE
jgi:hypothetical protein